MPLRIIPSRAALHLAGAADRSWRPQRRPPAALYSFHSSPIVRRNDGDGRNHYETLGVQTSASPKDIKRSFYDLSKTHHPDHNPDDPLAAKRFMRISEAYTVLSHADRRARYDRDVLRLHDHRAATGPAHRGASYSSTGPAGGRPASGLSRRRGTFRGPPPSFYRSGGWGAHGTKRSQAHEESTGGSGNTTQHSQQQSASGTDGYASFGGGMGPGQDPLGRGTGAGGSDIPHFDRSAQAAHTRTQRRIDEIRARNAAQKQRFSGTSDIGEIGSFFAVLGVLAVAVGLPYLVMRGWDRTTGKKVKTTTTKD